MRIGSRIGGGWVGLRRVEVELSAQAKRRLI